MRRTATVDRPATAGAAAPARWHKVKRWLILAPIALVVFAALGFGAWAWITLHYSYSTGERTGYVQKISKKGWVCKTWEGELAMLTQPGVAPPIFTFSVRDESVARKLLANAGKRVTLTYSQHPGVPTTCFGETQYYITNVQVAGP